MAPCETGALLDLVVKFKSVFCGAPSETRGAVVVDSGKRFAIAGSSGVFIRPLGGLAGSQQDTM